MASIAPIHAGDSLMAKGSAVAPEHHEMLTLRTSRPDDKAHDLPTTSTTSDTAPPPEPEQTKAQKRTELIRFLALLYAFFFIGWQDGSVGPLLPAIRANYKVGFTQISLIFILQCLGAGIGSFSIVHMLDSLGFGKVLVLGTILHSVAAAVLASAPPFPAFLVMCFIIGVGMSFLDATGNGYVASLKRNGERKMGLLHAAYGLGAFAAPLAATPFAAFSNHRWAFIYIVTACIGVSTAVVLSVVFQFKRMEVLLSETNEPQMNEDVPGVEGATTMQKLKSILKLPLVHMLALYIGLYVGVEITMGGWVVTFIIDERGGGPDAGYISSGFFGGLMLGRIILLPLNAWLGERRVIFLYSVLTIGLDLIIWRVPSLVGNAVAASLVGLLFGPWYPICMRQAGLVLPPRMIAGAVGYIAGFGIIGGAIIPFVTGALANKYEIKIMPIVVLVMTSIMIIVWAVAIRLAKKPKVD